MKSFTDENYLLYSIPILMEKIIGVEEGDEQRLELRLSRQQNPNPSSSP